MSARLHSVQAKLLGSALLLVALMAVLGITGIRNVASVDEKAQHTFHKSTEALADIGIARAKLNEARALASNHVLEPEAAGKRDVAAKLAANRKVVDAALGRFARTLVSPEAKQRFALLQRHLDAYRSHRDQVIQRSNAFQPGDAYAYNKRHAVPAFTTLAKDFDFLFDSKVRLAAQENKDIAATAGSARTTTILLLLLAIALGGGVSLLIARRLVAQVTKVLRAAEGIAQGDLDQDVSTSSKDELGAMARAFEEMVAYLREAAGHAAKVAEGDLTTQPTAKSDRDVLGRSLHSMVDGLRGLVGQVSATAGSLSAASQQMASSSEETGRAVGEIANAVSDVAHGAERQVRAVGEARQRAEQVLEATEESTRQVERTSAGAAETRQVAAAGADAVAQASEAMVAVRASSDRATETIRALGTKNDEIGGIVDTITSIAEQTNLLALNAAIEAARAGDQGRGFAVVADEVRKLAEESQQAAGSIAALVVEIQDETRRAVTVVEEGAERTASSATTFEEARTSFGRITEAVEGMTSSVEEISNAVRTIAQASTRMRDEMGDVAAVAEQSSASTEQVSASTEQTSASAQEIAASAQELAASATELEKIVARFRVAA
ncbi:methyl-accepting chemotaxis protein [Conexibacter sp. SYSU D00693]|uniref:methyl-accepting chemotaxis protein n=1 Tax=Conexibacter sp. SYSU D00693 TaxID=2812560 RepID=UPI00196ADB43|nr:HAMP domain-containing methyl-accepting chemotaxis protein [Conexibacter sp. SYSU D00693]